MDDATAVWASDYDTDALVWAGRQAGLLQRLAHGDNVTAEIDWKNVIEEVADVGLSELHGVMSRLSRAIEHMLKILGWPDSPHVEHWRSEILVFLSDADQSWLPSMRQRIDVQLLYERARQIVERMRMDGRPPVVTAPEAWPFEIDDLIPRDGALPDVEALLARLAPQP